MIRSIEGHVCYDPHRLRWGISHKASPEVFARPRLHHQTQSYLLLQVGIAEQKRAETRETFRDFVGDVLGGLTNFLTIFYMEESPDDR